MLQVTPYAAMVPPFDVTSHELPYLTMIDRTTIDPDSRTFLRSLFPVHDSDIEATKKSTFDELRTFYASTRGK
jgi:hypothetical protein